MPDIPKSCADCPALLLAPVVVNKFGKNIGAPVCGRYGHVLGKPGLPSSKEQQLFRHFAERCDAYGEPMPAAPLDKKFRVIFPDMDAIDPENIDEDKKNMCSSCLGCKNFVPPQDVATAFGWTEGLCAAKGKLILANRMTYEARNCEFRQFGSPRHRTADLTLLPEYDDAFAMTSDATRAWFKSQSNFVDPSAYETDKELTAADIESGIQAWREIADPAGTGNVAYLPIYRDDFFSEDERIKIPRTGDDEHPELYVDHFGGVYLAAVAWTELDETPAAWGEAGVGKTELFRHLAWLMCIPFYRISITGQTDLDDLAGKMHYTPDAGTYFKYGRLPVAWQRPCVLCIDEPNVGPPEVWQFLRPLTDNSKQLVLDMNEGEPISRHPDCYLGFAMNPAWDVKNIGANPIGDADANRLFHVFIEPPPEVLEREIIKNRVKLDGWEISEEQLDMVMRIAQDLRALITDGTLPITWGIRPQIKVARALRWFDVPTSYRRAIGDFLEPEAQEKLIDTVRAHIERK